MSSEVRILDELLDKLRVQNPRYSLRAFARAMKVSPAYLTMIRNGKRQLSFKRATEIADKLSLDAHDTEKLLKAVSIERLNDTQKSWLFPRAQSEAKHPKPTYFDPGESAKKLLSKWYYIAILDLISCEGFQSDALWIARRLEISPLQAQQAVTDLIQNGYIRITEDNRWIKNEGDWFLTTTHSQEEIRNFHLQMLQKAGEELKGPASTARFSKRSISGITMAVDPRNVAKAKNLIAKFKDDMADLMTVGKCTDVFQLNVQLFPLTQENEQISL